MPSPKEKPKGAKGKKSKGQSTGRSQPAISAKQAAKLLKDRYVQQLDQRQPETGSAEAQAVDQVEGAGSWAVDELLLHERPRSPRQPDQRSRERPRDAPEAAEPPDTPASAPETDDLPQRGDTVNPRQRPGPTPKEKATQVKEMRGKEAQAPTAIHERPSAPPTAAPSAAPPATVPRATAPLTTATPADKPTRTLRIRERPAIRIKEQRMRTAAHSIKERPSSLPDPSIPSIRSIGSIRSPQEGPPRPVESYAAHPATHRLSAGPRPAPSTPRADGNTTIPAGHASARTPGDPTAPISAAQSRPEAQRQAFNRPRRGFSSQPENTAPQKGTSAISATHNTGEKSLLRARASAKGSAPKLRGAVYRKETSSPKAVRAPIKSAVARPVQGIRQNVQRRMTQQAVQKLKNTAKAPAVVFKRTAAVATRTAAALFNSIAALAGGGILLMALVVVIVVAAVANSPFGLFFAQEPNAPGTMSVAQAAGSVNVAYNSRLELLQAGDYDDIVVQGQAADWVDVLAVFAVKTAGADVDGLDVATLDADRVNKLTAVFWDMTEITVSEETIDHPASGSTAAWTEKILHITITAKTADDMRVSYGFSEYQNSALDELLSDRAALVSLAGSLAITGADARDVLADLPADLEQARQDTVQTALQLVGKVTYFWGGKSRVIGWDSRWGQLKKVSAAGSSTTGTYRPFGLDCSGFVDWTFNNSLGYTIGHGGGAHAQHTYCTNISQSAAQPGDLAFYPDDSHVGIIVGRNVAGKLLVCHCSSGQNNVVVTEFAASGFTAVGRPDIFAP